MVGAPSSTFAEGTYGTQAAPVQYPVYIGGNKNTEDKATFLDELVHIHDVLVETSNLARLADLADTEET